MQQQTQFNLTSYVTSSFSLLPLTATTGIVSSIVGGVLRLPTAKFINIVGRAEGFALMTAITTIGKNYVNPFRAKANILRSYHDGSLQ